MTLTEERALQIIEAFGPCTTLYECTTPKELVEEAGRDPEDPRDEAQLVDTLLSVESVCSERMDDTGDCYREWKNEMRPLVIERLRGLGIEAS